MSLPATNFSRSTTFELSTSSAFSSSAVKVRNWPRLYSYPLTTSRFSISSPVPGSCGRSVIRVGAGLCSPSGAAPTRTKPIRLHQVWQPAPADVDEDYLPGQGGEQQAERPV